VTEASARMRKVLTLTILIATNALAQQPRIKAVSPQHLLPGTDITVLVEYGPAVNEGTIELSAIAPKKTTADVSLKLQVGGLKGVDREYYAKLPDQMPAGKYRLFLSYNDPRTPKDEVALIKLVAPQPVRVIAPSSLATHAWLFGLLAGLIFLSVAIAITRQKIHKLWYGDDDKPSTSKFQFALWTAVVLFVFGTYAALYLINQITIDTTATCSFPRNIWIVLGLSGLTAVAAKGITVGQLAGGRKTEQSAGGGLVTSDEGVPDLTKVQLVTWTLLAIGVYLWQFFNSLGDISIDALTSSPSCHMPDIDTTLMVLMGLSQATYLGTKFVSTDTARITSITPANGPRGTSITIGGAGFGDAQHGNLVTIDNTPISVPTTWTETQVTFAIPQNNNGVPLAPGPHTIGLLVGGQVSLGVITFTLDPTLTAVNPSVLQATTAAGKQLVLTGENFGGARGLVLIDNSALPDASVLAWSDQQVTITLPANHPENRAWQPAKIAVAIAAKGGKSPTKDVTLQ